MLWKTFCLVPVTKIMCPSASNDYTLVALTSHTMNSLGRLVLSQLWPPSVCLSAQSGSGRHHQLSASPCLRSPGQAGQHCESDDLFLVFFPVHSTISIRPTVLPQCCVNLLGEEAEREAGRCFPSVLDCGLSDYLTWGASQCRHPFCTLNLTENKLRCQFINLNYLHVYFPYKSLSVSRFIHLLICVLYLCQLEAFSLCQGSRVTFCSQEGWLSRAVPFPYL